MTSVQLKRFSFGILVLPSLLIYAGIVIFPILFSLFLSFTEWTGLTAPPQFTGLQNYFTMFTDPVFLHGLRNNILIVLVSVGGQIPIALFFSYVCYRRLVRGGSWFQAMIFLPVVISAVIVAILWNQIFSPAGLYTALIRVIVDDPRYVIGIFEDKQLAIVPILFVILWYYTGVYVIIFFASMQKISPSIIESARIDGANERQIFFHIVLPALLAVVFTTFVFAISGSLKSFDLVFAMTGGGPAHYTEVIAIYMYINTFKYYKYGFGSAVSIAIVALSLGFISLVRIIFSRLERKYA